MEIMNIMNNSIEDFIYNNILYFAIAMAAIIGKIKESSKSNVFAAWIVYFAGTLFHELTHLIVSFFTLGKPVWFSVFPSTSQDSVTGKKSIILGYVKSSNMRWWNVFFISMAPLLLLPLSYIVYEKFFDYIDLNILTLVLYVYLIVSLLFSSIPSGIDFSNVFNRDVPVNLLLPILVVVLIYFTSKYNLLDIKGVMF